MMEELADAVAKLECISCQKVCYIERTQVDLHYGTYRTVTAKGTKHTLLCPWCHYGLRASKDN